MRKIRQITFGKLQIIPLLSLIFLLFIATFTGQAASTSTPAESVEPSAQIQERSAADPAQNIHSDCSLCTSENAPPFVMLVDDRFAIPGLGIVATGTILSGRVELRDTVTKLSLSTFASRLMRGLSLDVPKSSNLDALRIVFPAAYRQSRWDASVRWIELYSQDGQPPVEVQAAEAGQRVGLIARGIDLERVQRNNILLGDGFVEYFLECPYFPSQSLNAMNES